MRTFLVLLIFPLLTACSSMTSRRNPAVDITQYKRFYVEQRLNDNNSTAALIAADLRARGYVAGHGPLTMMPDDAQVLVTYDARWTWDFRSYLIDLNITAALPHSNKMIATGSYHQPGIRPKDATKMIHILLNGFFK
ncbi:MAG: hypothetical protein K9M98_05345 [Cephaloticoccus sp.]|nr:hypothetical protein [Cephaloticoccus sp.]MCF7759908.1 hypothetical protein [Cephaloticoccus sp.]